MDYSKLRDVDAAKLFVAGALSVASERGVKGDDAMSMVMGACKEAASKKYVVEDDNDDDEGTWWDRNKGWALPALIGSAAFWFGANSERNGRPDNGYITNAFNRLWSGAQSLLGIPQDHMYGMLTRWRDIAPVKAKHDPMNPKMRVGMKPDGNDNILMQG